MINHRVNIQRIRAVNELLCELRDKVVYVGGATVSLYADRITPDFRPTMDVDILVEVATQWDYIALEEKLRKLGFQNDTTADFVGRYTIQGFIVDVMSTNEMILGFSNKWYPEGFKAAVDYKIDANHTVKIFPPPYFIASKVEAFKNRGNNDGRTSTDFEDIIYVLENRDQIWNEMENADVSLRSYLHKEFKQLFNIPYLEEWLESHVGFNSPPATHYILDQWESFIKDVE